jgi:histone-lysine N-methyltransferase SETD1
VSDIREREYNAQGKEMYMFSTGDGEIIDATMKGNMARAMNHSCDVSAPDLRKQ